MTANELLDRLAEYPDDGLHVLRRTPVLDRFPADPATYLAIAQEAFTGADPDLVHQERMVGILREFLFHDGRSFDALMYVAERAFGEPEYVFSGINALAWIWCYLNMERPAPLSDEELVARFERWAGNVELRNNAANCRNLILRRRPDLAE
jgi:hypothetical protein